MRRAALALGKGSSQPEISSAYSIPMPLSFRPRPRQTQTQSRDIRHVAQPRQRSRYAQSQHILHIVYYTQTRTHTAALFPRASTSTTDTERRVPRRASPTNDFTSSPPALYYIRPWTAWRRPKQRRDPMVRSPSPAQPLPPAAS